MRQFLRALAKQRIRAAGEKKPNRKMKYHSGGTVYWRDVLGIGKIAAIRVMVKPKKKRR